MVRPDRPSLLSFHEGTGPMLDFLPLVSRHHSIKLTCAASCVESLSPLHLLRSVTAGTPVEDSVFTGTAGCPWVGRVSQPTLLRQPV